MNHNPALSTAQALFKEGRMLGDDLDHELRLRASQFMSVQLLLEDLPDRSNAVTVNTAFRDKLGQPGIRVHYRLQDYSKAALPRTIDDFANWVQAMNAVPQEVPGATWCNEHHIMGTVIMGTVIMGTDRNDSVVDGDLRCHDHENLFLVTTGVFPSVSCGNPTLTGMAVAVRAGQHIAKQV